MTSVDGWTITVTDGDGHVIVPPGGYYPMDALASIGNLYRKPPKWQRDRIRRQRARRRR